MTLMVISCHVRIFDWYSNAIMDSPAPSPPILFFNNQNAPFHFSLHWIGKNWNVAIPYVHRHVLCTEKDFWNITFWHFDLVDLCDIGYQVLNSEPISGIWVAHQHMCCLYFLYMEIMYNIWKKIYYSCRRII